VELDGECRARYEELANVWRTDPFDKTLPPIGQGYGTVLRWNENAMSYYWTGWPITGTGRRSADLVLQDQAQCHHYTLEFLARIYDMFDTAASSARQIAAMDRLLMKNFWNFGYVERSACRSLPRHMTQSRLQPPQYCSLDGRFDRRLFYQ